MNNSRLKDLMQEYNIKAADLARISGVSEGSISQYLSGRCQPSHKTAMKLAKALCVDVHEIYEPTIIKVNVNSQKLFAVPTGMTPKEAWDNFDFKIVDIEEAYDQLSEENKQKFYDAAMLILKGLQ